MDPRCVAWLAYLATVKFYLLCLILAIMLRGQGNVALLSGPLQSRIISSGFVKHKISDSALAICRITMSSLEQSASVWQRSASQKTENISFELDDIHQSFSAISERTAAQNCVELNRKLLLRLILPEDYLFIFIFTKSIEPSCIWFIRTCGSLEDLLV